MRSIGWRWSALATLLVVAAGGAIGFRHPAWQATAPLPPAGHPNAASAKSDAAPATMPEAAAPSPSTPSFDIVTVDPHGQAVIAGRSLPGDRLQILDDGKVIGEVTADARGEWALVPTTPIAAGKHALSLVARGRDGTPPRSSREAVALSVTPPATGSGNETMAVLLPEDASRLARVLQPAGPNPTGGPLTLDTVQSGAADQLILSGTASPGAHLDIYAGQQRLGAATANSAGKWSLAAPHLANAGNVELRLTELAADGTAAHRLDAPLSPSAAVSSAYIVTRGNSLWVIARRFYGNGLRYTAIYRANQEQIRDPDLIYPGQHFIVPKS